MTPVNPDGHSTNAVIVLCTAPDEGSAQELATLVLGEKLAACVTLLPGATSLYYWQGKLAQEYEVQMLFKTNRQRQDELLSMLKQHHPYELPELLALPISGGNKEYLSWLDTSLS